MLLGAAYYPEHRDPSRWDHDLDTMAEAGVNCLRVGEFAWCRFEPRPGEYDFSWMEAFAEKAWSRSIGLMMCPPLRTVPAWLVEQDRSILIEREDGVGLEFGSRYTFCVNHPLLREKGRALAVAMAQHYGGREGVVGWHLDNEHGDEPDCHCPVCTARFRQWCEERYVSIETLNERWGLVFWGLEFSHFGQIPTPRVSRTFHGPGHLLAWRRFRSLCTVEAIALQEEAVRPYTGTTFVTTNHQVWNPRTDYYDAGKHLDVSGTNYYPSYGEGSHFNAWGLATVRSYRRANFQVHELRCGPHMVPGLGGNTPAPGEVERIAMHCVAHGADALLFFRWRACPFGCEQTHGTITDYDGRPKGVYPEVKRAFGRLRALESELAGTTVPSVAGIVYDFPTWWVMGTGISWNGPQGLYPRLCRTLYDAFRRNGVLCDAVPLESDLGGYRLLVVPALGAVDDAQAERLAAFVNDGGTLLWHPMSGLKDAEARMYPDRLHPKLAEILGVDIREFATAGEGEEIPFLWRGKRYAGNTFCDLPRVPDGTVTAEFVERWYAGTPALVERRVGKGRVAYVMTFAEQNFYRDFLVALCSEAGVTPILDTAIPETVEVAERRAPDGRRFIFLLNSSASNQTIVVPRPMRDLYNEEDVKGEVSLPGFGVRVLVG